MHQESLWLIILGAKRHYEIYETRLYRLQNTKQGKFDVKLGGKIERS